MNTNIILFFNFNQVRILLHIVSEHTSEENNFIQVRVAKIKRSAVRRAFSSIIKPKHLSPEYRKA